MAGTAKIQRLGWSLEWMQRISEKGNENLGQLGYTDHSQKHCMQVAHHAESVSYTHLTLPTKLEV